MKPYSPGLAMFSSVIALLAIGMGTIQMWHGEEPNGGIIYMPMFAVMGWQKVSDQEEWDRQGLRMLLVCEILAELTAVVVFVYALNQWVMHGRVRVLALFALPNAVFLALLILRLRKRALFVEGTPVA